MLRNIEHTAAVHAFVAALARQAGFLGWEIVQLDPPRRASRYFRHGDSRRSVHPDAFGVLRKAETTWPFFLEWERRQAHLRRIEPVIHIALSSGCFDAIYLFFCWQAQQRSQGANA